MPHDTTPLEMRILWDVPIEMDDGVELRANVYLPPGEGRHPVVMASTSYSKDLPFSQGYAGAWQGVLAAAPEAAEGTSTQYISFEAPDPEKWIPHGYAVMVVDVRGVGRSPGVVESFSPREAQDYHDCIEWAGVQPWSSGKVGLLGMSYLGTAQWLAANLQPPHLASMIPWEAADDHFRGLGYHGGIPTVFFRSWYETQVKSVQHGLGSRGFVNEWTQKQVSGDEDLPEEQLTANHESTDIFRQYMQHPLDDGFYEGRRADWEKITVPFLSVSSWGAAGIHLRGNLEGFMNAASTQKWLVVRQTKGVFAGLYSEEGVELQRRFFDATLKGEGDFRETQPKVLLKIRDVHDRTIEERAEDAWPLERTVWKKLFFDLDADSLGDAPSPEESTSTYRGFGSGLMLMTAPLEEEMEITGPLACRMWVSSTTTDADLFLNLRVFAPDGTEKFFTGLPDPKTPLATGWLRASHRSLDPGKSLPYRPFHSHGTVNPLFPGDVYEVDVEIWPTCVVLPAGYRLGLSIAGKDFDHGDPSPWHKAGTELRGAGMWVHDDPLRRPVEIYDGEVTVHAGGGRPSHLLLPVIPKR